MVSIRINRNRKQEYIGFECSGHAGFGKKGSDIVCAAVSVLTQTTILALERFLSMKLAIEADAKSGYLSCRWQNNPETVEKADLLMRTMVLGLNEIQCQYPEHLELSEMEV